MSPRLSKDSRATAKISPVAPSAQGEMSIDKKPKVEARVAAVSHKEGRLVASSSNSTKAFSTPAASSLKATTEASSDMGCLDAPKVPLTTSKLTQKAKLSSEELVAKEIEAKRLELQKIKDKNARRMDYVKSLRVKQEEQENSCPGNAMPQPSPSKISKGQPTKSQTPTKATISTTSAVGANRAPISTRTSKVLKESTTSSNASTRLKRLTAPAAVTVPTATSAPSQSP
jgi:hypothetical protein